MIYELKLFTTGTNIVGSFLNIFLCIEVTVVSDLFRLQPIGDDCDKKIIYNVVLK